MKSFFNVILRIKGLIIKDLKMHGNNPIIIIIIILLISSAICAITTSNIVSEYDNIQSTKVYKDHGMDLDDNNTIIEAEEPEIDENATREAIEDKLENVDEKWLDNYKVFSTIFILFIVLYTSSTKYSDEYFTGNFKILKSSPMSNIEIMVSKYTCSFIVSIMPIIISTIFIYIVIRSILGDISINYIYFVFSYLILVLLVYIVFSQMISSFFKNNVGPVVFVLFPLLLSIFISGLSNKYPILKYMSVERSINAIVMKPFNIGVDEVTITNNFSISLLIVILIIITSIIGLMTAIKMKDT